MRATSSWPCPIRAWPRLFATIPDFRVPTASFPASFFQNFLRQIGLSEGRYVATRRQEELRDQLTESLLSGLAPPQAMLDAAHRYREERRVIEFFTPDYDKLIKLSRTGRCQTARLLRCRTSAQLRPP